LSFVALNREINCLFLFFFFVCRSDWKCPHSDRQICKLTRELCGPNPIVSGRSLPSLPVDLAAHSFAKFAHTHFRCNVWAARRDPIRSPFLIQNESRLRSLSVQMFRLLLKFALKPSQQATRDKLICDFIVRHALTKPQLRDELLCQLANQTWKSDHEPAAIRAWMLLLHCLSSFTPSDQLFKYLLKFVCLQKQNVLV
jgi:myosin-15